MADDCCNSGDGRCSPPPLASCERQEATASLRHPLPICLAGSKE